MIMAGRLLRHSLHFWVYAVCSRGTCHGVLQRLRFVFYRLRPDLDI
jgi:hypothetical protein